MGYLSNRFNISSLTVIIRAGQKHCFNRRIFCRASSICPAVTCVLIPKTASNCGNTYTGSRSPKSSLRQHCGEHCGNKNFTARFDSSHQHCLNGLRRTVNSKNSGRRRKAVRPGSAPRAIQPSGQWMSSSSAISETSICNAPAPSSPARSGSIPRPPLCPGVWKG